MQICWDKRLTHSPAFLLYLALVLLTVPLRWLAGALAALAVHEGSHCLALKICGGSGHRLLITALGIQIEAGPMETWKYLLCILAGPLGGAVPVLWADVFPEMAVCALCYTLYNLLPFPGLDGANALDCICKMLFSPEIGQKICRIVCIIFQTVLITSGILGLFLGFGIFPLLLALSAVLRSLHWKNSLQIS